MEKELVSVIIPVYNTERYLCQCVKSVINQSYTNIEIILVDDESTDSCGNKCDIYQKEHPRVKVIHKKNGGLSDARNAGVDIVQGKWIIFVDSDDMVHPKMIEYCMYHAKKYNADLVAFGYERVGQEVLYDEKARKIDKGHIKVWTGEQWINGFLRNKAGDVISCCKMYNSDIWENLRFPFGKVHEDEYMIYDIMRKTKKVVISESKLYYYRINENSITNSKTIFNLYCAAEAEKDRLGKLIADKKDVSNLYIEYLSVLIEIYFAEESVEKKNGILKEFRKICKETKIKSIYWKTKICFDVFCISPCFYQFFLRGNNERKRNIA